jgi:hypothetical protein
MNILKPKNVTAVMVGGGRNAICPRHQVAWNGYWRDNNANGNAAQRLVQNTVQLKVTMAQRRIH